MKPASPARDGQGFYLYTPSPSQSVLTSNNVFYRVVGEQLAGTLCRLLCRGYSLESGKPGFFLKAVDEVDSDEQILLDEALDQLDMYDDPDPGVYDPPPSRETMMRAEYARRASSRERMILERAGDQANRPTEANGPPANDAAAETTDRKPDELRMPAEDRRNSGLNLLFLLAQAYYKILECVISTASWCCALDLELNESYLWTITSLTNLLKNHEDLRDFPAKFEPAFPDLYPSTIRDVDWDDMVAPDVEQFLSTVQRYVRSSGIYPPEESSPAWVFVEMFRPSVNKAIERAVAYEKRMRDYAQRAFAKSAGASTVRNPETGGVMRSAFISYSWDDDVHREWVRGLAARLRKDGVDVSIDRWAAVPGDQLPAFMERAIRENQFVVIICTPRYKRRSDAREGGVGYEGDIMAAEVMTSQNDRKFIPVLRSGVGRRPRHLGCSANTTSI